MSRRRPIRSWLCLVAVALCLLTLPVWAVAQVGRDPLTPDEADQLRDTAASPDKRIKLLLGFAGERLTRFGEVQAGSAPDRQATLYRLLREYDGIIAELGDNLDQSMSGYTTGEMTAQPKLDKPLESVIAAERGFLAQLAKIQSSSAPADLASYHFELSDTMDDTRDSLSDAQADLAELAKRKQEAKQAKKRKKHHP